MEINTLYDSSSIIHYLEKYLNRCFAEYKWTGFMFKSSAAPEKAELKAPKVYAFLCPPDEIEDSGFPSSVPSVTIMLQRSALTQNGELTASISVHTALYSPSIADAEKAVPDSEIEGLYNISDSDVYTREKAQRELYESCLLVTSRVARILRACPLRLGEVSVTPPDGLLPDFPYITSRIDFDVSNPLPKAITTSINTEINDFINQWL